MFRSLVVTVACVVAFCSVSVAQSPLDAPTPCTEGVFLVHGAPLLPGSMTDSLQASFVDAVILRDGKVSIASGCPAVIADIRPTQNGTIVRASWRECPGHATNVRFKARIGPHCQKMRGGISAAQPPFKRRFLATQCNDSRRCLRDCKRNVDCADDMYCAKLTGHCDDGGKCRPLPQACPDVVDPVCGCDGKTYTNACEAAAAGVTVEHEGRCRKKCGTIAGIPCPDDQLCEFPAGTCDHADQAGVCVEIPNACPENFDPVCGCDGKTYGNDCERRAAGAQKAHDGRCECRNDCDCYQDRDFQHDCPLLCPNCGSFWTCEQGRCVEQCGQIPQDICPTLCVFNEHCQDDSFCFKRPGACGDRGLCRPLPTACTDEVDPVCGCDGRTYSNPCEAAAAGVSIAHRGSCERKCGTIAGIPCPDRHFCDLPEATCNVSDGAGICTEIPEACLLVYDPVCGCDDKTYGNDCERRAAKVSRAHDGPCDAVGPTSRRD